MDTAKRLYILLLILSPFAVLAQDNVLYFNHLGTAEGLPSSNYLHYILHDSEGYIWISSQNGSFIYDGNQVKALTAASSVTDSTETKSKGVDSDFFEDTNRNIWSSTQNALLYFDKKQGCYFYHDLDSMIHSSNSSSPESNKILYFDTLSNELWVWFRDKIVVYFPGSLYSNGQNSVDSIDIFQNTYGRRMKIVPGSDEDKKFFLISLNDGWEIKTYEKNTNNNYEKVHIQNHSRNHIDSSNWAVNVFHFENEESLWIGADTGLFKYNILKDTILGLWDNFEDFEIKEIQGIVGADNNFLIVATKRNGLYFFNKKIEKFSQRIYIENEEIIKPFDEEISNIYLDREQNLWIFCPGKGIYHTNLTKRKFKSFFKNHDEKEHDLSYVKAIDEDSQGRIWNLTKNGIQITDQSGKASKNIDFKGSKVPFNGNDPYHLFIDKSDGVWVCMASGLFYLSDINGGFIKVTDFLMPTKKGRPVFTHVCQLQDSTILISNFKYGISKANITQDDSVSLVPRKMNGNIGGAYGAVYETPKPDNRLFVCKLWHEIQIYHNNDRDTSIRFSPFISGFLKAPNSDTVWMATDDGLHFLERINGRYYLRKVQFPPGFPNSITGLVHDDTKNDLWLSSTGGLLKYSIENSTVRLYHLPDGLASLDYNIFSFKKTSSGKIAFGSVNGLNLFHPDLIKDINSLAKPVISEILINGNPNIPLPESCPRTGAKNISYFELLTLPYAHNDLDIYFGSREYSDPQNNRFRYRRYPTNRTYSERTSEPWVTNPKFVNFARFEDMQPGYFIFEVDASNSDGKWSGTPAKLKIRILPPWYRHPLAYISYALIFLGIVYAIYRNRIRQIRKEAEYNQKVAEIETAVLRLQMNPHFIFNSMNSINSYILEKDVDTASDYLTRFAKLMRMILKFAEKPLIAVADEMELLELYLHTEAMRLEKDFTFSFDLKNDLDPDEFLLPTMILQPFVENSIWHGISHLNKPGHIRVSFWEENNALFCSVSDNGIGREAAAQKNIKFKSHESKALSITKRRLELLKTENGIVPSFKILDLTDAKQQPTGTEIQLKFPIL